MLFKGSQGIVSANEILTSSISPQTVRIDCREFRPRPLSRLHVASVFRVGCLAKDIVLVAGLAKNIHPPPLYKSK